MLFLELIAHLNAMKLDTEKKDNTVTGLPTMLLVV